MKNEFQVVRNARCAIHKCVLFKEDVIIAQLLKIASTKGSVSVIPVTTNARTNLTYFVSKILRFPT